VDSSQPEHPKFEDAKYMEKGAMTSVDGVDNYIGTAE
jgi:hypothetical protein